MFEVSSDFKLLSISEGYFTIDQYWYQCLKDLNFEKYDDNDYYDDDICIAPVTK